jgi:hypothetical protein
MIHNETSKSRLQGLITKLVLVLINFATNIYQSWFILDEQS